MHLGRIPDAPSSLEVSPEGTIVPGRKSPRLTPLFTYVKEKLPVLSRITIRGPRSWGRLGRIGIQAALASALFSGLAPVLGKSAILSGFSPDAVVVFRTAIATGLLIVLMALFRPQYFFIYPVGLVGCLLAGVINGLGSLFYYHGLGRVEASLGHLLYSFYPLFVALWLRVDRQKLSPLTYIRLAVSLPAVYLLVSGSTGGTGHQMVDLQGAVWMIASSILYALHLIINQRVLYEVPAPTVTLYTLLAMTAVVVPAYLLAGGGGFPINFKTASLNNTLLLWWPILGLALVTFLSRLTLFLGVKHLGGMQTALLGLAELLVAVGLAGWWLGEKLTAVQWAGAALLATSLLLVGFDKPRPERRPAAGWFAWLKPPEMRL